MTKSRTALLALAPIAAAWPGGAFADPARPSAEDAIAAYDAQFHQMMRAARSPARRSCPTSGTGSDAIVVCGRDDSEGFRVPYEAVPGEVHHIAGETMTGLEARESAERCLRLCNVGLSINIPAAVSAIARGVDRILHPD